MFGRHFRLSPAQQAWLCSGRGKFAIRLGQVVASSIAITTLAASGLSVIGMVWLLLPFVLASILAAARRKAFASKTRRWPRGENQPDPASREFPPELPPPIALWA
jgi:hypothetical protein